MASTLDIKRGDTRAWTLTLKEAGSVVDIRSSLVSTCKVYMWEPGSTANVIDGSTVSVNSSVGVVSFTPTSTQVATAGRYYQEVEITFADSSVATFPSDGYNLVEIEADRST